MAIHEYGTTWWGKQWLLALEGIDFQNRIPRGKSYANTGKVYSVSFDENRGLIKARVRGHYDPFYSVKITLPRVAAKQEQAFIKELAKSPLILAKLSSRELDPQVLDAAKKAGIEVFPSKWSDLKLSCSCPDFAVPCKHIAAVIYKVSQEIDANPFVLFNLKGIDIFDGLKRYGIRMEQTQVSEMPKWSDLLTSSESLPPLPLESLNKTSYVNFEDILDSVMGLFTPTPAGYTEGSLKELMHKVLLKARSQVQKQLADKTDRDLPQLKSPHLFTVSAWGRITPGDFVWKIYPAVGKPYTQCGVDTEEKGFLCDMFSGTIGSDVLADAPEEIEALFQIWMIACKLVSSGSVMPQIFEPIDDFFAIRWIPAVISDEVNAVVKKVGQAMLSLKEGSYVIDRAPENLSAAALGQIVLSMFLGSFIAKAYSKVKDLDDDNPDRAALFLGKVIDTEEYLNGEAIKMRLEAWLSPLYLENLTLSPVIVLSDLSHGQLQDYVDEKRGINATAGDEDLEAVVNALRPSEEDEPEEAEAEETGKKKRGRQKTGVQKSIPPLPGDEPGPEPENKEPADPAEEAAVLTYDESIDTYVDPEGTDTIYDGRGRTHAMPELEPVSAQKDPFSNEAGVGILMGFKEQTKEGMRIIPLKDVIDSEDYAAQRFECLRTVSRLSQVCPPLGGLLENHGGEGVIALDDLYHVVSSAIPALKLLGVELIIPKALKRIMYPKVSMSISTLQRFEGSSFSMLEELLKFDWTLAIGGHAITEEEFEFLSRRAGQMVRFKNEFVMVDEKEVAGIAKRLASFKPGEIKPRRLFAAALTGKFGEDNVLLSKELKEALDRLLSEEAAAVPKTLNASLRPYQERGYSWLVRNLKISFGSIIADDMGLGKTLQVIAALEKMREDKVLEDKEALVVVPTSLLVNWQREISKFAPRLTYKAYYGQARSLEKKTHITLTTYGILRSQLKTFKTREWAVMVIDEAQAIKSPTSQIFKAVRSIKAGNFIAMSGTPVENRLLEYWAIMDFANPGLLGTKDTFNREFAVPIESRHDPEVIERFRSVTGPFIMRRLKSDKSVISDLKDKLTTDRYCFLTAEQTALYNEVTQRALQSMQDAGRGARNAMVLSLIRSLKEICNCPEQYDDNTPFAGPGFSGKASMLFSILDDLFAARRKAIIFTQFIKTGELLTQWIKERYDVDADFLHGGVSLKARSRMVDRFQTDRKKKVLVLSLKAAGTGLNLTAASAVIHFDLWWNPAAENQATDRAYRIGQKEQVEVFRLICANTFEEKINEIINSKQELAELTVGSGEQWIGDLSARQLEGIFAISSQDEDLQEQIAQNRARKAKEEKEAGATPKGRAKTKA